MASKLPTRGQRAKTTKQKSPLARAKDAMSGKTTARRVAAADKAAAPRVAVRKKPVARAPVLKVAPKHAAARKARIKAARDADLRAIAAKKKNK